MPALRIRDVPEETVAALKRRAQRHGHSVQQELRAVLARAVAEPAGCDRYESLGDMTLLAEDAAAVRGLLDLVARGVASGKQVRDASIVAVACAHGAVAIVTDTLSHLARFSDLIRIEGLPR